MQPDRERLAQVLFEATSGPWEFCSPDGKNACRHEVAAILTALTEQGFAVVPETPTEAMLDAFVARALNVSVHSDGGWTGYAKAQWAAMLAAHKETAHEQG